MYISESLKILKNIKKLGPNTIKNNLYLFKFKNRNKENVLHLAIINTDYYLVNKILDIIDSYHELLFLINEVTYYNETPLSLAEKKNCPNNILSLLKKIYNDFNNNKNSSKNSSDQNELLLNSIKPKGLNNIHGSCYLNTVLQCFFHVKPLSLFFLKEKSKFYENSFSKAYLSVILGLCDNNKPSFKPLKFKEALIEKNPNYDSFGCDPKDVIIDFLFFMNQELLDDELSFQLNNKINKCNKEELFKYNKEQYENTKTIISELFGWFKQINRNCFLCSQTTYEFIFDFYFIFNLQKISQNIKNEPLNLINCFKDYFKNEKRIFTCQNCHKKISGTIENRICVLPKYLIIILDRGKNDKYNCQVDFDNTLDLREVTEQIEKEGYNAEYELIGATFLLGLSGAGHTVAFCKHFDGEYYLFDDSNYKWKQLNELNYLKSSYKAFLLFYERKNY